MVYDNIEHWEKLYSNHFNLAGSGYPELGEAYNRWLYKLRTKVFNKALIEHNIAFSDNLKVLDIGCGTGFFTNEFQKREIKKLVGYDLTRISIEKLRIRFPQYNFFQQDISAPLKSNDRFNFINIFDVLWYLDDADFEKAFNNLAKLSQKTNIINPKGSGREVSLYMNFTVKDVVSK